MHERRCAMDKKLTPKQARFVAEYLVDLNASAAARRAGYSVKTADAIGRENLGKPTIAAAIAAELDARSKRVQVDADWVLRRLHAEATADLAALYNEDGEIKPMSDWPMVFRQGLVTGFETVHEVDGKGEDARRLVVRKVKLSDRIKHVELIGRHVDVAAFKDRVEVDAGAGLVDAILAARKRARGS